jgi:hypothetical protein
MFAISHAATALLLKRRYPSAGLWALLFAVQAVELLWVILTYLGIEHIEVAGGTLHLGFLPYSHSVFTGVALALLVGAAIQVSRGDRAFAVAVGLGIVSHIVLDIVQHERDIHLFPAAWGPRLGLGLTHHPLANFAIELVYGVVCWRLFGGRIGLLVGIIIFNLLDLPLMLPNPDAATRLGAHPAILTTIILVQIIASWLLVARLARRSRYAHHLQRP